MPVTLVKSTVIAAVLPIEVTRKSSMFVIAEGVASVYTVNSSTDVEMVGMYTEHQYMHIKTGAWHQLVNETDKPLKLIEIQYGTNCIEEDITRK